MPAKGAYKRDFTIEFPSLYVAPCAFWQNPAEITLAQNLGKNTIFVKKSVTHNFSIFSNWLNW